MSAAIWGQFMNEYHEGLDRARFPEPEPVRSQGYLQTPGEIDSCSNPGQPSNYSGRTILVDRDRDGEKDCFIPATTTTQASTTTAPPAEAPGPPPDQGGGNQGGNNQGGGNQNRGGQNQGGQNQSPPSSNANRGNG